MENGEHNANWNIVLGDYDCLVAFWALFPSLRFQRWQLWHSRWKSHAVCFTGAYWLEAFWSHSAIICCYFREYSRSFLSIRTHFFIDELFFLLTNRIDFAI